MKQIFMFILTARSSLDILESVITFVKEMPLRRHRFTQKEETSWLS